MNDLMNTTALTMSSLEIATLVESQHSNVRISIKRLVERGVITLPAIQEVSNEGPGPKAIKIYNLEKRDSIVVVAQLSPEFTARIVDRWQELEEAQNTRPQPPLLPRLPAEVAEETLKCVLRIATLAGVPASFAMQEAAKITTGQSGIDFTPLLTQAACMNDVPQEDVMLEPTELGKLFEMSGAAMNKTLAVMGLQSKEGGVWVATEAGAEISTRHAWAKRGKSGYNLKWKAATIEGMIPSRSEQ